MNLSLDVTHTQQPESTPLRSPPVHVGGTSSVPMAFSSPPGAVIISPQPVAIDMPSPASFDPLLEHFLQVVEPSAGTCACLLERSSGGRSFRMVLEAGNIPLLQAERSWSAYAISAADGTRIASLSRSGKGAVLSALSLPASSPELAAYVLSECELNVPSRPKLNRMQLAMATLPPAIDGAPAAPTAKLLGRPPAALGAAIGQASAPGCALCESRLPGWDAARDLLTLDFPPGRALLASVQNFQLVPAAADPSLGQKKSSGSVVLVHGLMNEAEDGVDTYSLDFAHPLSPIVAFGAVLAAQAWQ